MSALSKRLITVWACLMLGLSIVFGQPPNLLTRHIGEAQGFPNQSVWGLLKDSKGFVWIGTSSGLCRFDGYQLVFYKGKPEDPQSLSDNYIFSLHEDRKGKIWVGTLHGGVNRYDPGTDSFERMFPGDTTMTGCLAFDFKEDQKGNLWIATSRGVHRYDGSVLEHILYSRGRRIDGRRFQVRSLHVSPDGRVWMGGYGAGLGWYDPDRKVFGLINGVPLHERSGIRQLTPDREGNLWMSGYANGLIRLNPSTGQVQRWTSKEITLHENSTIISLAFSGNELLLGTSDGLISFENNQFDREKYGPEGIYGLDRTVMFSLLVEDNRLWVGTEGRGVYSIYRGPELRIHTNPAPGKVLNQIWNGNRKIIMAYEDHGLVVIDSIRNETWLASTSATPQPRHITSTVIWTVAEDRRENIWVGTRSGMFMINSVNRQIKDYTSLLFQPGEVMQAVPNVTTDSIGRLWVVASNQWMRYDSSDGTFRRWRKKGVTGGNSLGRITESKQGTWIGSTDGGLVLFTPEEDNVYFNNDPADNRSLSNNFVTALFTDSKDRVWVGTNHGLNLYVANTNDFQRWISPNGLGDERITEITEDTKGNLLVQDFDGIYRLPADSISTGGHAERLNGPIPFTPNQGVLHYPYFSWTQGNYLAQIRLDSLRKPSPSPVVITSFTIDPNNRQPLDSAILRENPVYRKAIHLDYDQNLFSIEFAALEYGRPEDVQYAYQLDGFDKGWTLSGTRRFVTYTNLDAGNYTFRVKSIGSDVVATLEITISPPPWKTWWAYSGYGIIFIGLLLFGRKITVNRERLKAQVAIEQKEKQTLRELDHLKTKFFSNITHEFRTPLTLIQGPADELLEKTQDSHARDLIGLIKSNSNRLLKLINQLLDLAKLDAREMKLNNSPANLVTMMKVTVSQFKSHAESKGVDFVWQIGEMPVVQADVEKLETILTNLISNAIKFTPRGGKVDVQAHWDGQHFVFVVRDTGCGIPAEKLPHIFDRFYQVSPTDSTHAEGTGIGLALVREYTEIMRGIIEVESKIGLGTTFTIKLPLTPVDLHTQTLELSHTLSNGSPMVESASEENGQIPLVLLVEDNAELRRFIRMSLGKEFRFCEASQGREGMTLAVNQVPDLIISDLMMPEMDGLELCTRLKMDKRTDHIPFIMLTAKAAEENKLEGLRTGADDYLVKPFNKVELLLKVQNLITLRHNLQAHIRTTILAQASDVHAVSAEEQFVLKARLFVEAQLKDETLSVETLAKEMNLSREQCYRKISALTGLAPSAFIRKIKLQRAHQLLTARWGPVSQVAYETGFENLSYFSKAFKEEFGKLPSEV